MIGFILDIVAMDDWDGICEEMEIAKGRYKLPENIKEGYRNAKRKRRWQSRKQ